MGKPEYAAGLRRAAAAVFRGIDYQNSYTPIVLEYAARKRLSALGFTSNLSDLSADKADAFLEIDLKLSQIMNEKIKK